MVTRKLRSEKPEHAPRFTFKSAGGLNNGRKDDEADITAAKKLDPDVVKDFAAVVAKS